jgi:quaternary ammonium compound-resistance protein SugE
MPAIAMKSLPVGTSNAIEVGAGAVGAAIPEIMPWGESAHAGRLMGPGLVVAGIMGLEWATPT